MRLTFLGTGTSHGVPMIGCGCAVCASSDPRDARFRPSVLVTLDHGSRILIDTTPDLRSQALRFGVVRVDAVLYTHSHADHILGFDEIRRYNVLSGRQMPVYADARTLGDLRRTFEYAFEKRPENGGGIPDVRAHEVTGPFLVEGQPVTPVPVLHGRRLILGYRLGRLAYLTDCSAIPDASLPLLEGLDVLVLSALRHRPHPTHFTVAQALAAATRIGAGRTYFTHMCHDLGHEETTHRLPAGTALAHDGLVVELAA